MSQTRPYPPQLPKTKGEGTTRASATTVAGQATGQRNAAPPRKIRRGRALARRPRRHRASPRTGQWARRIPFMTSRAMGFGWPQRRPSTGRTSPARNRTQCWARRTISKPRRIGRGRRKSTWESIWARRN